MKNKRTRIVFSLIILLALAGTGLMYYLIHYIYNKPARSASLETAILVTPTQIATDYSLNEEAANKIYLNKAIDIHGIVSEISSNQLGKSVITFLGTDTAGVQCTLLVDMSGKIKKGDKVRIKAFCTGFLTDVVLDRGVLVQ